MYLGTGMYLQKSIHSLLLRIQKKRCHLVYNGQLEDYFIGLEMSSCYWMIVFHKHLVNLGSHFSVRSSNEFSFGIYSTLSGLA